MEVPVVQEWGGGGEQKQQQWMTINHSQGNQFRQDDHSCKYKDNFKIKSQQEEQD